MPKYHSQPYSDGVLVYISMCTAGHLGRGPDGLNIKILCTTIYITTFPAVSVFASPISVVKVEILG